MEWRDNHFTKLKQEQLETSEKEKNIVLEQPPAKRKGVVLFTFYFILFFVINLLLKEMAKNTYSGELFVILSLILILIYIIFGVAVHYYAKNNSFSREKRNLSFFWLALSLFIFPVIIQIGLYIYMFKREVSYIVPKKEPKNYHLKEKFISIVSIVAFIFIVLSYFYGGYKIIGEKYYTSKHLIIGLIFPPYTIYVGVEEFFKDEPVKREEKSKAIKSFDSWIERELNN